MEFRSKINETESQRNRENKVNSMMILWKETDISVPVWRGRERGEEETQEGPREGDRGRLRVI